MSRAASVAERARIVEEWTSSGLTLREFAHQHGVAASSLSRWAISLRRGASMVPVEVLSSDAGTQNGQTVFREVGPGSALVPAAPGVRISLPSGVALDVPVGADVAYVRALVAALDGPC